MPSMLPAAQYQDVIQQEHGELAVLVPECLREHSEKLLHLQTWAIDLGALSAENVTEIQNNRFLGWAAHKLLCFFHFNIPPIARESLVVKYPDYVPLSLVERRIPAVGDECWVPRVVAGMFGIPSFMSSAYPRYNCTKLQDLADASAQFFGGYFNEDFIYEQR
jgi:hypothetical protein